MKTQSGRSMIEMLGVLAIIGVLSIGGLAGYTRAMNSYQANQIMDYFNRCSIAAQEKYSLDSSATSGGCNTTTGTGAQTGILGSDACPISGNVTYSISGSTLTVSSAAAVEEGVADALTAKGTANGVTWSAGSNKPSAAYDI